MPVDHRFLPGKTYCAHIPPVNPSEFCFVLVSAVRDPLPPWQCDVSCMIGAKHQQGFSDPRVMRESNA